MERESQSTTAGLITRLEKQLPRINFYRFCQLLELSRPDTPGLGSGWTLRNDPVRFRPHPGMGFPASELKALETDPEQPERPPTIRTTFLGLYGVTSPLPTRYLDDIAQRREGYDAVTDFLDIFNHRLTTQFWRIWRKYSYPATFRSGGSDTTSQYLLGLIGLGIPGVADNVTTPVSRFLALLGSLRLPTRTAEGICAMVALLAPGTRAEITPHDRHRIPLDAPLCMSAARPVNLAGKPVMGRSAIDVNSQILVQLSTLNRDEAQGWLPGGQLHTDLLALLHVYLGARLHVRLQLSIPRALLPDAGLRCNPDDGGVQIGRTAVLRQSAPTQHSFIKIGLGRYQGIPDAHHRREPDETGGYRT